MVSFERSTAERQLEVSQRSLSAPLLYSSYWNGSRKIYLSKTEDHRVSDYSTYES